MSDSLWPHVLQHARLPCPSPTPGAYSNSYSLSWWCHPTISSSVVPFSSCPHSFSASGSLPVSELFASGGQSIGVSASAWVLPMNIQGWFPLGLTGWISLLSKGLSRVFPSPTIRMHQFSSINPSKNIRKGGVNCESTPPRDEISQGPLKAASLFCTLVECYWRGCVHRGSGGAMSIFLLYI